MAISIRSTACVRLSWRKHLSRSGFLLHPKNRDTWLKTKEHNFVRNFSRLFINHNCKVADHQSCVQRCCLYSIIKHRLLEKRTSFSNKTCNFPQFYYFSRYFSSSKRCLCDDKSNNNPDNKPGTVLKLMDFPEIVWPSVIFTMKNWILSKLIIRPYLDKDFSLEEFGKGAKQAFLLLSTYLFQGKLENMHGLVTEDALEEIKKNFSCLSVQQRNHFEIITTDVYFSFPYQVGIMLDDSSGIQKRFVEITMCFHSLLGSEEIKKDDPSMSQLYKFKDKIVICNCRFIKEFTKGSESDWTVNVLNYFQPSMKG